MLGNWKRIGNAAISWLDHARKRPRLAARPTRVHLAINDYCNLACPLCLRSNPEMPKNTANMDLRVVEAVRPALRKATHVCVAGNGEPFLHPRFYDILDIVAAERAVPCVITNFTLIDREAARRLVPYGRMILLASIDGGTKEVYEAMRRPAKFAATRENLLALKREKESAGSPFPVVQFIVTLTRMNKDDLPNVIELARETGAALVSVQKGSPYVEGQRAQIIETLEEYEQAVARGREAARRAGLPFESHPLNCGPAQRWGAALAHGGPQMIERDGMAYRADAPAKPAPLYCPNIWSLLLVLANGDVWACCYQGPDVIGNVLQEPVMEIWNHPSLVRAREQMLAGRIPTRCAHCHVLDGWDETGATAQARRLFFDCLRGRI